MSCFHVFPKFREFVVLFGEKTGENEIGPPHFKFRFLPQSLTIKRTKAFGASSCLRSLVPNWSKQTTDDSQECAYALRFVEFNGRGEGKVPWSVRQTAVY